MNKASWMRMQLKVYISRHLFVKENDEY